MGIIIAPIWVGLLGFLIGGVALAIHCLRISRRPVQVFPILGLFWVLGLIALYLLPLMAWTNGSCGNLDLLITLPFSALWKGTLGIFVLLCVYAFAERLVFKLGVSGILLSVGSYLVLVRFVEGPLCRLLQISVRS